MIYKNISKTLNINKNDLGKNEIPEKMKEFSNKKDSNGLYSARLNFVLIILRMTSFKIYWLY
jgi:hypothetical protein